jgi:glutathione S-transferase
VAEADLTLHYLTDSRAQRVLWMLEELEVPYRIEVHRRTKAGLAPDALRAIHPLGKAPILVDGGVVFAESGHIVEHLAETYGPALRPTEGELGREHRYWMHFAEGSLAPPLITRHLFRLVKSRVPWPLWSVLGFVPTMLDRAYYDRTIADLLRFVDDHLDGREHFVGESLTGADVMMLFPLEAALPGLGDGHPNIARFVRAMQARPAYQRALQKPGVPYTIGQR